MSRAEAVEVDIEQSNLKLGEAYDVTVLLHVLEHLREPEAALMRLLSFVKAGGIIIGGHPTLPDRLRSLREAQLRKKAMPFGHVSVISPYRLKQASAKLHLSLEFLTGAYLFRMTGTRVEQSRLWLRLNLLYG